MDNFIQRIMDNLHHRVFPHMPQELHHRRSRKLAVVEKFTGRARSQNNKENGTQANNVKALLFKRWNNPLTNEVDSEAVKGPVSMAASSVKNCRRNPGKTKREADGTGDESLIQKVKTCSRVPVEIHETPKEESAVTAGPDLERKSVESSSNLLSIPTISTANLLEEIEADLPSSCSLANMLDHTFHTVTNLRTCARLSRVGTNIISTVESAKNTNVTEHDSNSHVKYLQKEAFIQKTIIDQADKAVKLCKYRKKNLDDEDIESLKILLLAKLRYDVINLELQNFRLSGREWKEDNFGELSISDLCFTVNDVEDTELGHFICVAFHRERLFASPVETKIVNGKLHFPVNFKFDRLNQNFIVYLELYQLASNMKCKKDQMKAFGLRRLMRIANQFIIKDDVDSGDHRDFFCVGSATLRLDHVKRREAGKVSLDLHTGCSVFGKILALNLRVRAFLNSKMNGFLNLFKNTCWHRLWCCQSDYYLHFWRYPEDKENGKAPLDSTFLPRCREDIRPVSMDVCIRPHSFLILFKEHEKNLLLSASSNREMTNWINHLKFAIRYFESWTPDF